MADLRDQVGLRGKWQEITRQQEAPLWVLPAYKGFKTGYTVRVQAHLGLIMHPELTLTDGPAEVPFHGQSLTGVYGHAFIEKTVVILAAGLHLIHGQVRIADQLLHVIAGLRKQGDTDTDADKNILIVQLKGLSQSMNQLVGDHRRVFPVWHRWQKQSEFISTEAGECIALAKALLKALGNGL